MPTGQGTPECPQGVPDKVELRGTDKFLLGLEGLMGRSGQGQNLAVSVLVMDGLPNLTCLQQSADALLGRYPLVGGRLRWSPITWLSSWKLPKRRPDHFPICRWRVTNTAGEGDEIASLEALCGHELGSVLLRSKEPVRVRLSILTDGPDRTYLLLTWSHLMLDGIGAEMFLEELVRDAGESGRLMIEDPSEIPKLTMQERWEASSPIVKHFFHLAGYPFHSLSGPKLRAGDADFILHTFSEEETTRIREHLANTSGPLFPMPFYLCAALWAHEAVHRHRGNQENHHVVTVPVQMKHRDVRQPLFLNHMSLFFFGFEPEMMRDFRTVMKAVQKQYAQFMRQKIGNSFLHLLGWMRRVPARPYMSFVRTRFRGEFTSFFHSHTGEFAPKLDHFHGAKIVNGYHVPGVSIPPGTGIFCSDYRGRLTCVVSWRGDALDEKEKQLMFSELRAALLGELEKLAS